MAMAACREMLEPFAAASPSSALKHQAYSPCGLLGTRKHAQTHTDMEVLGSGSTATLSSWVG